ncbi:glycosyltransferase family 2 protein, partial [Frankia nepalensis]|uniref:glycosyltransferase family 2 protein n=1 Tax=Frankia nepalensis TaxID=1836974 RepID=UPI00288B7455
MEDEPVEAVPGRLTAGAAGHVDPTDDAPTSGASPEGASSNGASSPDGASSSSGTSSPDVSANGAQASGAQATHDRAGDRPAATVPAGEAPVGPSGVEVSVVMPCLNEEASVADCVRAARAGLARLGLPGEVLVVDNGSTDASAAVAAAAGARVVSEWRRGYGNAYLAGFAAARGRLVVMGDADSSYDFTTIDALVAPLLRGEADYVLGSRLGGRILPGAMPWLHRYVGNPVLTAILNRLFGVRASDAHSGMRAFTREGCARMALRSEGMELASEIVIAAARVGLRCVEVPITYHPRVGASKLDSLRDGWRHLRFMLLLAPRHVFVLPGLALLALGLLAQAALLVVGASDPTRTAGAGSWYGGYGTLLAALAAVAGGMLVLLGVFADAHHGRVGWRMARQRPPRLVRWALAPDRGGYVGGALLVGGIAAAAALGALVTTAIDPAAVPAMPRPRARWFDWSDRLGAPAALPAAALAVTVAALGLQGILGTLHLRLVTAATRSTATMTAGPGAPPRPGAPPDARRRPRAAPPLKDPPGLSPRV